MEEGGKKKVPFLRVQGETLTAAIEDEQKLKCLAMQKIWKGFSRRKKF